MKTSRRTFIKTGTIATTGVALLPSFSCAEKSSDIITSVQLYCVRDDMRTDPLGSLTKLAEMGYKYVEHANYVNHKFYGWTAAEFKKVLDDLGLKMPSGHTSLGKNHWDSDKNDFTDDWKMLVDDAAYMGQKFVVSPWLDENLRETYDSLIQFMEVFNKCGELCQMSGMQFGYHNHDFEFSQELNGEKIFDLIMKNTDPDKVVMQLDMGNMYIAGALAKDVIGQYPGRYGTIHVKDMIQSEGAEGFESTILGKGLIGTRGVTDMAKESGTTLFVIEQESYQDKTPMECMEEDLAVMKSWGY
ncbi:MAG: sugar phosphate isomerase/epimerase [Prolixibacteraceae bacterium]|nr:sugar phosphate isomerase/epimerase [Prolixibacteraceae bacterium]MBN2774855.1 sugar phosphate isomerase/epimerase [Prolixibacteraceae bacterium]